MRILEVDSTKSFMSHLLVKDTFHRMLLQEAKITTYMTVTLDGHIQKSYYTADELEERKRTDFLTWEEAKGFCYDLIKGKKLPLRLQITLMLPPEQIEAFIRRHALSFTPQDVRGLYFNIRMEENNLQLTSATNLSIFTTDTSLEEAWHDELQEALNKSLQK